MTKTKYKKLKLKVVGETTSGTKVVNGARVFKLMESIGLPLDTILTYLKEESLIVDWIGFYEAARNSNWSIKLIFERVESALDDYTDSETKSQIIKRLKYYVMKEIE